MWPLKADDFRLTNTCPISQVDLPQCMFWYPSQKFWKNDISNVCTCDHMSSSYSETNSLLQETEAANTFHYTNCAVMYLQAISNMPTSILKTSKIGFSFISHTRKVFTVPIRYTFLWLKKFPGWEYQQEQLHLNYKFELSLKKVRINLELQIEIINFIKFKVLTFKFII